MEFEIDLKKIKAIAEADEEENWDFRSYLKFHDMSDEELDDLVHQLNESVEEAIDCTKCANCCKHVPPDFIAEDVRRISNHLKLSESDFAKKFLRKTEDGEPVIKELPCPFLDQTRCSIYDIRPKACQSYPHLHKPNFRSRLLNVVQNCALCPIVFNVYEELKGIIRSDDMLEDELTDDDLLW